ncbi:hypothetical protein [Piscinibacter gummiphilus]|uniref:hypothetical protein n=1 Tax=Piscinibacter gummiphilus TaxID=946333 RepID=UPI000A2684B9|nr:hypothetical protein [Piscinibacter gummiphilus]ATU67001.1 hypothetical protein CPZ87_21855 [Piscinibacter gummiphilus]GLS94430.1 hypothetical protein GCM10007918_17220 [Piscinibacter gummiphilus]
MSQTHYDAEAAPEPGEWLALDEGERIRLAQSFHVNRKIRVPRLKLHAVIHVVVENQLAMGFGPSCRALVRLQKQGLSRHDAVHAIGSVVMDFVHEGFNTTPEKAQSMQVRLNAALESLSADSWRNGNA